MGGAPFPIRLHGCDYSCSRNFLGVMKSGVFFIFLGRAKFPCLPPGVGAPSPLPGWVRSWSRQEKTKSRTRSHQSNPIPSKQPPFCYFFFPQKLFQKQQEIAEHPHPMHRALPWWDAAHSSLLPGWDMWAANAAQNAAYIRTQGVRQQVYGTICEKSSLQ